jgi:non-ribosomal peptide synthetase component E (peptide arylation enzyme)|tara:strand:- start:1745 stop:2071 length:327 start_codon:yes stop_codon:yes gene_type:complete
MGVIANERLCKQPSEQRKFSIEFNNLLATSETVSSISSVSSEKIDGSSSDLVISTTGIETSSVSGKNSVITFWVSGGTTGNTYKIEAIINTSDSATLEGDGILFVTDR